VIIFDARRRQSARCLPKSRRWVVFLWRYSAGSGKPSYFLLMMMRRWRVVPGRYTVFCVRTPRGKREIRWSDDFQFLLPRYICITRKRSIDRSMMGILKILLYAYNNICLISRSAINTAHATCAPIIIIIIICTKYMTPVEKNCNDDRNERKMKKRKGYNYF